MNLTFGRMKHRELREAAEVATRAFDDYEYFTNSEKNIAFYKKLGFEVFDFRTIEYRGKTMGSWSVKKKWY